ncbi:MAG: ligand-binding SRPBCC domain-containing protein [Alteromonas macleodii]|jgi:ligand-binding SRPBCC domain-containing protein
MPRIELETLVKADRKIVFDLSRSIDLHKISTQHTDEEAIAGKTSGLIDLNETVTWRAKHFAVYQTLTSKITEFNSPDIFVDEMVEGAFKRFRHEHKFLKGKSEGETILVDIFDYESPFGLFGKIADKLFLETYMTNILTKRNQTIKDFAETGDWKSLLDNK